MSLYVATGRSSKFLIGTVAALIVAFAAGGARAAALSRSCLRATRAARTMRGNAAILTNAASCDIPGGFALGVLHTFSISDGSGPTALLQARDGNFYGTIGARPFASSWGSIFKVEPSGNTMLLHAFNGDDGSDPGSLIEATDGKFYGTAGGTIFRIDTLGNFERLATGVTATALIEGADGYFYGTTYQMIFRMDASGNLAPLHMFDQGVDGEDPTESGLIQARDGNFYGTTKDGGESTCGTIYKLDSSWHVTVLYSFPGDRCSPQAGLIQAADGNFYGTTARGGQYGYGIVFVMDASGKVNTLHSFMGSDGSYPSSSLMQAADGTLYGTTDEGGANGYGTLFKMTAAGQVTTIHCFAGSDGSEPYPALVQSIDGSLYGTTFSGGSGAGVFFRLSACDSPVAQVSGDANVCAGASTAIQAVLTGTAPWKLTWSDGFVETVAASPAIRTVGQIISDTTYSLLSVSDAFCDGVATGSAVVTVRPLPSIVVDARGPTTFCPGGSVLLTATASGGSGTFGGYQWYGNSGVAINGATSAAYTATSSGTYSATAVDSSGCTSPSSNSVAVTVSPLATATVSGSATICKGSAATIQAALTGVAPWNVIWSDGLSQTAVPTSPIMRSVSPNSSASYSVRSVVDASCGTGTSSGAAVITVQPAPKATVTGSATICSGGSATVQADLTGTPPWTLTWSDGYTQVAEMGTTVLRNVSPSVTTGYSIAALSDAACAGSSSGTATVKVSPLPSAAITASASVCPDAAGERASVPNAGTGAVYMWSIVNGVITAGDGSRTVTFSAGSAGSVALNVTVTDPSACAASGSKSIAITPSPAAAITAPASICRNARGSTASVADAGPGATYVWTLKGAIVTAGAGSSTITFDAATKDVTLLVTITNANGCKSSSSLVVPIDPGC